MNSIFDSNGNILLRDLNGIAIKTNIIQGIGEKNVRTYKRMSPIGVTVHNTGNTSPTAGDEQHGKYLQNVERDDTTYVSWHFTIDCDSITQHLPVYETAYHAGDGSKGVGNSMTIGIEICENKDYAKAEANAVQFILLLCKTFNWKSDTIKPHRFFAPNKKLCPVRILKSEHKWQENWSNWVSKNFSELDKVAPPQTPQKPTKKYSDWAEKSIDWSLSNGLVAGVKDEIDWKEPITLERLVTILERYNKKFGKGV